MSGLTVQAQTDFAAGSFSNPAKELIPPNGFEYVRNGLLNEDGTPFVRGGSAYQTSVDFAAALTFLWDGYVAAGSRTVFASATDFGVLASDDATPINLGGSGTDGQRPAAGNGLLFMLPGQSASNGTVVVYGGSRKVTYATGTITTTTSSKTVAGAGTSFTGNVDAGMLVTAGGNLLGVVASVDSGTQLTLRDNARAAVTASAYSSDPLYSYTPFGSVALSAITCVSNPARLVGATGADIWFLTAGDPFAAWDPTNFHRIPEGGAVVGMEALRATLFAFSTQGVFTVRGMDFDLTDAAGNIQQRLEQISKDIVLLDARGLAGWSGSLLVPATDDVYLVNETAAPVPLAGPIHALYRNYVRQGVSTGMAAVHRNHYMLPVLSGSSWVDTLILRLDQGGWTFWNGHAGSTLAFAARAASAGARSPKVFSTHSARLLDLTACFMPSTLNPTDADGSIHEFDMVTRAYTLDSLRKALIKKLRVRYELEGSGASLRLEFATSQVITEIPIWGIVTWGSFVWGDSSSETFLPIPGDAPVSDGSDPYVWPILPDTTGRRQRFARFRLRCTDSRSKLVIHSLELLSRPGGRQ